MDIDGGKDHIQGEIEMANKNEVIAAQSTAVAPSFVNQGTVRGTEHVDQSDLIIPRLELVQSLSPCRKKADPSYIEGADEGMMYNSVTRELYGTQAVLVPISYKKEFLLWKKRDKGGGFRGVFKSMEDAEKGVALLDDAEDIEITDTAQHFCLMVKPNGQMEEIVVSMAKSKLKTSRKWNSLIRIAEVDSFAKSYKVSAVTQTNAKNQDYFGFDVAPFSFVTEPVYRRAEKLWGMIEAGQVTVSTENQDTAAAGSTEY